MAKKKKAPQLDAWCWYCDREFEDEKGGLAVHLGQVHKAEPGSLENTLPGRSSFDIEIYGMAGVPEPDLREWMARRGARQAQQGAQPAQPQPKRPRIDKAPLTPEQLRAQLEAHKALMNGLAPSTPYAPMYSADSTVPPAPPPAAAPAASTTAAPPESAEPLAPSAGAPPAPASPSAAAPVEGAAGSPAAPAPPGPSAPSAPPSAPAEAPAQPAKLKKSRMAYTDPLLHPDEKRAQHPRYAFVEA